MSKLEQHSCWLEHTALSKANTKPNFLQEKKKQHEKKHYYNNNNNNNTLNSFTDWYQHIRLVKNAAKFYLYAIDRRMLFVELRI